MRNKKQWLLMATVAGLALGYAAHATENISYAYDARGRLIQVIRSGSAQNNNNVTTNYTHDKANNRTRLVTANSPNSPPGPPPPPPSSNQPPVANPDNGGSMQVCKFKNVIVTSNDTDPEGNLPLTVTSATGNGGLTATVYNSTTIQIESSSQTGTQTANYTVSDSLGASSTGTVTVTVSGGVCQ